MKATITTMLLALAMSASAGTLPNQYASVPGATCKVAGVNGGTGSSPFDMRAIGGRNVGTTAGVFVICPFALTPTPSEGGVVTELDLNAYTIDGSTREMTCTAVIGSLVRIVDPTYSSKVVTATSAGTVLTWTAADFGGTAGDGIPGSAWATITCNVPPQTGIGLLYAKLNPAMR